MYSLDTDSDKLENIIQIKITIATDGLSGLARVLDKIGQVPNVVETRRIV